MPSVKRAPGAGYPATSSYRSSVALLTVRNSSLAALARNVTAASRRVYAGLKYSPFGPPKSLSSRAPTREAERSASNGPLRYETLPPAAVARSAEELLPRRAILGAGEGVEAAQRQRGERAQRRLDLDAAALAPRRCCPRARSPDWR